MFWWYFGYTPGRILHQLLAIDFTSHRGNLTSLASASPPNPPRRFASLRARTALQMTLQHCPHLHPHHSLCPPNTTYHPYACGVPSQHAPDTTDPYACVVPSRHAPNTAYHPYARCALPTLLTILTLVECPPDRLPTLLTILMLVECTPNMLPTLLTILMLVGCPPNTTDCYACVVPSQHAPDTAYHPYARGVPS
ncbi:hypothetical protein O181_124126 [Austropuccinia psidii MF-1]|uniref:Uncharacterized protein n=1 Tax=Austropuccinia psidii MF-1 TaxID=1389203 RepID=A0A9Q3KQK2_9BASI|nr:hypothetical protein [Austropuccinia psidii MF-1]